MSIIDFIKNNIKNSKEKTKIAFEQCKKECIEIDVQHEKKCKEIEERYYKFTNGEKVDLTLLEIFLYKVLPKLFWILAIITCTILAVFGGIFYLIVGLLFSIIIGIFISKII